MPASPTNTAVQQLILNTAFDVSGDSGPLLENLETFTPAPPWRRVSGDTAPLRIVLVDDGGTVVDTPRRVILASGNTLSLTAKVLPTDNDLALSLTFVQAGDAGGEYYEADPGTLAVDTDVFNSQPAVSLSVDFIEKTAGGAILRQWRTGLSLLWSTTAGSVASPLYYVGYGVQSPTSPQKSQALTNLGGTTVGKAVFSLTNPSAVTWLRVNADNTVTALSAADTRAALGAGTGSGDLLNSGTITLLNAGKVAVVTTANTLGAGVAYTSATTASTIVSRDSAGQFKGGNTDIEARVGPSASGPNASYAFGVFDALDSILMGGFRFVGFTANDLESVAYKSISAQFKAWDSDGATFRTANGTEAGTFGASNSTGWTFPGDALWSSGASSTYVSGTGLILNDGTNDTITLDTESGLISSTSNTIFLNGKTITAPAASGTLSTLAGTETLTNKTLTSPVIATIVNTGTLTLPTSTDTLVGRATTDTLTNKTLTNPTVTNYVETPYSANSSTAITIALTNGTVQIITFTGPPPNNQ